MARLSDAAGGVAPDAFTSARGSMATIAVGTVDVVVLARHGDAWHVLALQRALDTRCPLSWEIVHGRIAGAEEPEDAARRELAEETGLAATRLYSVRVQPIYLVRTHTVHLGVGFAAVVSRNTSVTLGPEHVGHAWLTVPDAGERLSWPADRTAVREAAPLVRDGTAGPLEDVLRVI